MPVGRRYFFPPLHSAPTSGTRKPSIKKTLTFIFSGPTSDPRPCGFSPIGDVHPRITIRHTQSVLVSLTFSFSYSSIKIEYWDCDNFIIYDRLCSIIHIILIWFVQMKLNYKYCNPPYPFVTFILKSLHLTKYWEIVIWILFISDLSHWVLASKSNRTTWNSITRGWQFYPMSTSSYF